MADLCVAVNRHFSILLKLHAFHAFFPYTFCIRMNSNRPEGLTLLSGHALGERDNDCICTY